MARTSRRDDLALTLGPADEPLRHRIGDALVGAIRTGGLQPGDPLLATRAITVQLGVSRTAVAHAYEELSAAGYVATRPGSGTFVRTGIHGCGPPWPSICAVPAGC